MNAVLRRLGWQHRLVLSNRSELLDRPLVMEGDFNDMQKGPQYTCSVATCRNASSETGKVVYYVFPKDLERCSLWVKRCRQLDLTNSFKEHGSWHLSTEYRICSNHFIPADFIDPQDPKKGLRLTAVPTIGVSTRDSDTDSFSDSAEPNSTDSQSSDKKVIGDDDDDGDSDSDSWDDMAGDSEVSNLRSLKKKLIDQEKENARLKRTVDRLRRQNVKYKKRLS